MVKTSINDLIRENAQRINASIRMNGGNCLHPVSDEIELDMSVVADEKDIIFSVL